MIISSWQIVTVDIQHNERYFKETTLSSAIFSFKSDEVNIFFPSIRAIIAPEPNFSSPIMNITVPVGREGVLTCVVHDLISYKVNQTNCNACYLHTPSTLP